MQQGSSNVELVNQTGGDSELMTEFTKGELANFAKAFDVFDVNKDGKISTFEIFDVLHAMGNEVSPERKDKIREAVKSVDKDASGDLNQEEFIKFMAIMQRYNLEEKKRQQEQETNVFESPAADKDGFYEIPYGCCGEVTVRKQSGDSQQTIWHKLNRALVSLVFVYQFLYVLWTLVIVLNYELNGNDRVDEMGTFPEVNNHTNKMGLVVHAIRLLNVLNWLVLFKVMLKVTPEGGPDIDNFRKWGFDVTFYNRLRYHCRPLFVWNALANIFFLGGYTGLDTSNVANSGADTVQDDFEKLILPLLQLISVYACMSPFWYLSRSSERLSSKVKTFISDFLYLNLFRGVLMIVMIMVSFVALAFVVLAFIPILIIHCTGSDSLSTKGTFTYKVFYLLEYLSVENFHTCCQCRWGITSAR